MVDPAKVLNLEGASNSTQNTPHYAKEFGRFIMPFAYLISIHMKSFIDMMVKFPEGHPIHGELRPAHKREGNDFFQNIQNHHKQWVLKLKFTKASS